MKIILTLLISYNAVSSEFCKGYEQAYKSKYKRENNTTVDPIVPICPIQPVKLVGDTEDNYEQGYIIGTEGDLND